MVGPVTKQEKSRGIYDEYKPVDAENPCKSGIYRDSLRREGDSNPRNAFDVYTLSRRASSATRAPLQFNAGQLLFSYC